MTLEERAQQIQREIGNLLLEKRHRFLDRERLPLCLLLAKLNDPPPPNWREYWAFMVRR